MHRTPCPLSFRHYDVFGADLDRCVTAFVTLTPPAFLFYYCLLYNVRTLSPRVRVTSEMSACVSACVLWGEGVVGAAGCVGA